MAEFKRFLPQFNVVRFHSSSSTEKKSLRNDILRGVRKRTLDVVVTTYEMPIESWII